MVFGSPSHAQGTSRSHRLEKANQGKGGEVTLFQARPNAFTKFEVIRQNKELGISLLSFDLKRGERISSVFRRRVQGLKIVEMKNPATFIKQGIPKKNRGETNASACV